MADDDARGSVTDNVAFDEDIAEKFLQDCGELRQLMTEVVGRRLTPAADAERAAALIAAIRLNCADPAINAEIVDKRDTYATPLTWQERHHCLHGITTADSAWQFEVIELSRYGVDRRALRSLREQARKHFARTTASNHPLVGSLPLSDAIGGLATEEIFETGKHGERLTRRQALRRTALARRDIQRLGAAMLLVTNVRQKGRTTFKLSYTLAVGGICIA